MERWSRVEEEYKRRLVSAEEAVKIIKSGDRVVFSHGCEPPEIEAALTSRRNELRGVTIFILMPRKPLEWFDPSFSESFSMEVGVIGWPVRKMFEERRCDYYIHNIDFTHGIGEKEPAILITEVSPPNKNGFCSFGAWLWNKKIEIKNAKKVIAAVNPNFIRTYGDNFVHFSEIDYFVPHTPSREPGTLSLLGKEMKETSDWERKISENVSSLVRDGDTIQIGVGTGTEPLVALGTFDNKNDLGWHSEATPRGIIPLVKKGVFTGRRKTINQEKVVATMFGGLPKEDLDFINENPLFELYQASYINDIRTIAAHDNMVAINNALSADLTGQVTAESIGTRLLAGAGGQTAFAIGSILSKGGRSITVLPSTAQDGKVSRIVPLLERGTIVTLPRIVTDYVVTEYGIAKLRDKGQRQRVEELIAIAHPDFRSELRKEARKLYWP